MPSPKSATTDAARPEGDKPECRAGARKTRLRRGQSGKADSAAGGRRPLRSSSVPQESRRDLLPDIEEINSSLRSAEERDFLIEEEEPPPARASGFGLGFTVVVVIAVALVLVYVYAAAIRAAVPSLAPAMDSYVALADAWRAAVDRLAQDWVRRIIAMLQSTRSGG